MDAVEAVAEIIKKNEQETDRESLIHIFREAFLIGMATELVKKITDELINQYVSRKGMMPAYCVDVIDGAIVELRRLEEDANPDQIVEYYSTRRLSKFEDQEGFHKPDDLEFHLQTYQKMVEADFFEMAGTDLAHALNDEGWIELPSVTQQENEDERPITSGETAAAPDDHDGGTTEGDGRPDDSIGGARAAQCGSRAGASDAGHHRTEARTDDCNCKPVGFVLEALPPPEQAGTEHAGQLP